MDSEAEAETRKLSVWLGIPYDELKQQILDKMSRQTRPIVIWPDWTGRFPIAFEATDGCCWYCGEWAAGFDHVVPKSRGGADCEANIVPACRHCNSEKHTRTLEEYRSWLQAKRSALVVFWGEQR